MKIPDPPTSPSLISLNGFCGRKAPCFLLMYVSVPRQRNRREARPSPYVFFHTKFNNFLSAGGVLESLRVKKRIILSILSVSLGNIIVSDYIEML